MFVFSALVAVFVVTAARSSTDVIAFTATIIMIAEADPNELGAMNGIGQSFAAAARAIGTHTHEQ